MNPDQQEKLKRFVNDRLMAETVHNLLLKEFLVGDNNASVEVLAAERIAINLLQDAWKTLERYGDVNNEPRPQKTEHV